MTPIASPIPTYPPLFVPWDSVGGATAMAAIFTDRVGLAEFVCVPVKDILTLGVALTVRDALVVPVFEGIIVED